MFRVLTNGEIVISLTDGVEYLKGEWHGVRYDALMFETWDVDFVLDDSDFDQLPLETTAAFSKGKLAAVNGGGYYEFDTYGIPKGVCAYRGHVYCKRFDEPSIYISQTGVISWEKPAYVYHAINYPHRLITNGVKRTGLDNKILDRRTLFANRGRQVWIVVTDFMTSADAAELLASFHPDDGCHLDGGQSSDLRLKGQGIGYNGRPVPTHLGIVPRYTIPSTSTTLTPPFSTPNDGKVVRFLRDEELKMYNYRSRVVMKNYKKGALPATVPLDGQPDFVPLTREWQELWFECLKWQAAGTMTHDQLLDAWRSITRDGRALTDQHAWDNGFRDWIQGINLTAKDMCQRRLSMAGNIASVIGGTSRVAFKALDLSKPAPALYKIWEDHSLIWWATETDRPNWFDGGRLDINGRWPQLGDLGVPFLNVAPAGVNYVSGERVEFVDNDIEFTPYHPPTA